MLDLNTMTPAAKEQLIQNVLNQSGLEQNELATLLSDVMTLQKTQKEKREREQRRLRRESYLGRYFLDISEGEECYYKVVSSVAIYDDYVSCFFFSPKDSVIFYGVNLWCQTTATLKNEPALCGLPMEFLEECEEISAAEYEAAYKDWTQKLYDSLTEVDRNAD